MVEAKLERLALAGIQLVPADLKTHFIMERNGFLALVERREDDFGAVGTAGLLTEGGLAPLVWRGDRAFFQTKGFEHEATPEQVSSLRKFQEDLQKALA